MAHREHVVGDVDGDRVPAGVLGTAQPQPAAHRGGAGLAQGQDAQEVGTDVLGQVLVALGDGSHLGDTLFDGVQLVQTEDGGLVVALIDVVSELVNAVADILARRIARGTDARIGHKLGPETGVVGPGHVHPLMQVGGSGVVRERLGLVHPGVDVRRGLAILGDSLVPVVGSATKEIVELLATSG